jgi:hypothetical protein
MNCKGHGGSVVVVVVVIIIIIIIIAFAWKDYGKSQIS